MPERRRTERIFVRIPIAVQGLDQTGKLFSEQAATVEVNRDGARIGLQNSLRLGDEVRITNLVSGFVALFRVTFECPHSYGDSPEWGVALSTSMSELMPDFWGIDFEDWADTTAPHISALLVCGLCGRQGLVAVSGVEYEVLRHDLTLPRVCANCRTTTDWEPGDPGRPRSESARATAPEKTESQLPESDHPEGAPSPPASELRAGAATPEQARRTELEPARVEPAIEPPPAGAPPERGARHVSSRKLQAEAEADSAATEARPRETPALTEATPEITGPGHRATVEAGAWERLPAPEEREGANRRGARRVALRVPILVRAPDGRKEETVTRDVSKTGLSFPTDLDIGQGDDVGIVVGYGVVASPVEQTGRVAWRRPEAKGVRSLVGVRFLGVVPVRR